MFGKIAEKHDTLWIVRRQAIGPRGLMEVVLVQQASQTMGPPSRHTDRTETGGTQSGGCAILAMYGR